MVRDMPKRPPSHELESWSKWRLESALPADFAITWQQVNDYGVDARVSIFESGSATGLEFNVQLKAQFATNSVNSVPIKRATLNFWAELADPTLLVLAEQSTDSLWYQWAHLLPWEANPNTASRALRVDSPFDNEFHRSSTDEVRAFRYAGELHRHLPIEVALSGDSFYAEDTGFLFATLRAKLRNLKELRIVHTTPQLPNLSVSSSNTGVEVRLSGRGGRQLTWGISGEPYYPAIAADIIAAMAFAVGEVGTENLGVKLLEVAASESGMLVASARVSDAMAILTRHSVTGAAVTLMKRSYAIEDHPNGPEALVGFASTSSHATPQFRRAIIDVLVEASAQWSSPGPGLYNAANLIAPDNPADALVLYDECGELDSSYRNRAYWWLEIGRTHWKLDSAKEAGRCYEKAIELGEPRAEIYLADVHMRTGIYRQAYKEFQHAPIWDSPDDAQWRLSYFALASIVDGLGVDEQSRATMYAPDFEHDKETDVEEAAVRATEVDMLNGWAQWALCPFIRDRGESAVYRALIAAISLTVVPEIWQEFIVDVNNDNDLDELVTSALIHDALIFVKLNCESEFVEMLLTDSAIDSELRSELLRLLESLDPGTADLTVRVHTEGDTEIIQTPIA